MMRTFSRTAHEIVVNVVKYATAVPGREVHMAETPKIDPAKRKLVWIDQ
jgi:hypothetical protein